VDRLIDLGRTSSGITERQRIYRRIHSHVARDRPAIFLFFRRNFIGSSAGFEGMQPNPESLYRSIKDWRLITETKRGRR
jgi:ABC-type transport system substrate-binding protein